MNGSILMLLIACSLYFCPAAYAAGSAAVVNDALKSLQGQEVRRAPAVRDSAIPEESAVMATDRGPKAGRAPAILDAPIVANFPEPVSRVPAASSANGALAQ